MKGAAFLVAEDAAAGTPIGALTFTTPPQGPVDFSITAGNDAGMFSIDGAGTLTLAGPLDFETLDNFSITVRATDANTGEFDESIAAINLVNVAEIQLVTAMAAGWEGTSADFFFQATSQDGAIVSYSLDIDCNGTWDLVLLHELAVDAGFALLAPVLHLLPGPIDNGTFDISVMVSTEAGTSTQFTVPMAVANRLPDMRIVTTHGSAPFEGAPGMPVNIGYVCEELGNDTITQVVLDFGDGTSQSFTSAAAITSHVYAHAGDYTVKLYVTDEDGTWQQDWPISIGPGVPPASSPQIYVWGNAVLLANGAAQLTAMANGPGQPTFAWDTDFDGNYDNGQGPVVVLQGASGTPYPYAAAVRVTFPGGQTEEFTFIFNNAGPVAGDGWTMRNYRDKFLAGTPKMPTGWEVHHMLQVGRIYETNDEGKRRLLDGILMSRFANEKKININHATYLRGVDKDVHAEITRRQRLWWNAKMSELQAPTIADAMRRVNLDEYQAFVNELKSEFDNLWVEFGASAARVNTVKTNLRKYTAVYLESKNLRTKRLVAQTTRVIAAFVVLDSVVAEAKTIQHIAYHNPTQQQLFDNFLAVYEMALQEVQENGYVKRNRGFQVKDEFIKYARSMNDSQNHQNRIKVLDAVLEAQVVRHLED